MDDVEYILRLVLKARDDMAVVLQKARREIRAFSKDANSMNTAVTNLNAAMDKFDGHLGSLTSKLQAWRSSLRDVDKDGKQTIKTLEKAGKTADSSGKSMQRLAQTQKQLQDRAAALNREVKAVTESRGKEIISAKYAASEYERLGKQLEGVALKMSKAARVRTPADIWAINAREAADNIKQIDKEITDDAAAERKKRIDAEKAYHKQLGEQLQAQYNAEVAKAKAHHKQLGEQLQAQYNAEVAKSKAHHKQLGEQLQAQYNAEVKESKAHHKQLGEELQARYSAEVAAAKAAHKQLGEQLLARYNAEVALAKSQHKQVGETLKAQYDADVAAAKAHHKQIGEQLQAQYDADVAATKAHHKQIGETLKAKYDAEAVAAKAHHKQIGEQLLAQYKTEVDYEAKKKAIRDKRAAQEKERNRLANESAKIDRGIATPTDIKKTISDYNALARTYGRSSFRSREFAHEVDRLSVIHKKATTDTDRHGSALSKLSDILQHSGKSAAGFDNQMRGTGILFAVASINELISAAIALGGELVSLAGSAVMAGGALGGILAAGAAQALPVLGLLAGAASRAKSVFEAFQQSQTLDKAKFTDSQKAGQKSIDQANTLANANDAVAAANDRLAESRDALNKANAEGVDQLEDLIYAEKQAALAARGAALDVKGAQEALADALRSGADQLEIDQKRQALAEARMSQGRSGTTLRRATRDRQAAGGKVEGLDSVKSAAKAVTDAEKAVVKANRGLDQAADKSDRAASTTMTAAANLEYLLSQLSPAERKLYESFTKFYENYKRIFSGTSEKDGVYGVIVDSFSRAVDKVNEIIQMPDVIKTIQGLSDEIAKQIDKIVGSFTTPEGLEQLQNIIKDSQENLGPLVDMALDLAHAFLNISETANPAFQKLLEYLGPIVDKFLAMTEDSGKMEAFFETGEEHLESWLNLVGAIIGLFAVLTGASAESGKTSIEDLTEKIKTWTDWLKDNREDVVGFFEDAREAAYKIGGVLEHLALALFKTFKPDRVDDLAKIFHEVLIPALEEVMDMIGKVTDFFADMLKYPVVADIAKWAVAFALLGTITGALFGVFAKVLGPIAKFAGGLRNLTKWIDEAGKGAGKMARFAKFLELLGKVGTRAIPFVGWGLAIATVLEYFGLLDDAWDEIQQAAGEFWGQIEPPIKRFMESFSRLIDAVKEGQGAFAVIVPVIREFLEIIVEIAGFLLKGLGKALGQVIGGIIDILGGLIDVITGILTGDLGLVWEGIKDMLLGVANLLIGAIQLVFFKGVGRGIAALWKLVKTFGKDLLFYIQYAFVSLPEFLGKVFAWAAQNGLKALKGLPGKMWELAKEIVWFFWRGYSRMGQILREGVEGGWKWLKVLPSRMWELAKDVVTFFWRGYRRLGRLMREGIEDAWNWIKRLPARMWELAKDVVSFFWRGYRNLGKMLRKGVEDGWDWIKGLPKRLGDIAIDAAKKFADAFKGLGKAIIDGLTGGAKGAGQLALKIAGGIFTLINNGWNKWLGGKEFGIGPAKFKIPKLDLHLAEGGPVPGSGSGDTVRALLTPGEHVLTKREVAAAGGHDAIFALRRMLGGGGQSNSFRYADGGIARTGMGDIGTIPQAPPDIREDYKKSTTERAENWRVMWNDMLITTRRFANDIEEQFREMRVNTSKSVDRMYRDIRGSLDDIEHSFDVRGGRIVDSWGDTWDSLMKITNEGLFYIGHETNKALTALGEDAIHFHLTTPKASKGKAPGGWIGNQGERGKDHGFYALGRGEAVLNWQHQPYVETALNAQYGFGLGGLFDRVRGYHRGGPGQAGFAGGKAPTFATIPGFPAEEANTRVIPLIVSLVKKYSAVVTDAFDRDHSAGHKSPGHNVTGTAMDAVPSSPSSAGWNAIEAMGKWAVAQGMTVGYGAGVPGSQAWPGHGRGLHIHIELGSGGGAGAAAAVLQDTVAKIGRPVVKGAKALASLSQASIDKVLKIANAKLAETFGATSGGAFDFAPGSVGPGAGPIFKFFKTHGFTDEQSAAWVGNFQQESALNPSAVQPSGEGHGYAQWGGGRFAALMAFAKSFGKPWTDSGVQLAFVMHELGGSESAAYRGIKAARSVEEATNAIGSLYERYGIKGDRSGPARDAYKRFAGKFAEGGIIEGPDGAPRPILAHAGEWVLNKGQQFRAAMMAGLSVSGLRSMLGFHGGGGSFAGGGEIDKKLGRIQERRSVDLGDDTYQTVAQSLDDLYDLATSLKMVGKMVPKRVRPILSLIELATKENGFLDQLRTSIENKFTKAGIDLRKSMLKIDAGKGGEAVISKTGTDVTRAQAALDDARSRRGDLTDERKAILTQLNAAEAAQKKAKKGTKAYDDAAAKVVDLNGRLQDARDRVITNEEEILAAQEALAKAEEEAVQDNVDAVKAKYEKSRSALDRVKRVAQALGTGVESVNNSIGVDMNNNLAELKAALADAESKGQTGIADKLKEDIDELETSITEFAAGRLQDAIDAVDKRASIKTAGLDLFGRMADAMGIVGNAVQAVIPGVPGAPGTGLGAMSRAQVAQGRIDVATDQRAGYVELLARARAEGNVGQETALIDKINELTVEIAENTKAAFDAKVSAINSSHDYTQSMADLELQLLELDGQISGQIDQDKKKNFLTAKGNDLLAKGQELSDLLLEATPGTQAYNDLQKAILENTIASKQNTIAVNELTGAGSTPSTYASTAWTIFRSALLTGTGGVMPQYTPSAMQDVGSIAPAGSSSTNNNGNTFVTTIEVNEAGGPIDATQIASTVVFAQSTAQR